MRGGDWAAAWAVSDAVLRARGTPDWTRPRHLQAVWDGTPLQGRRVLVRCYHGLGDTIQFIRLVPQVGAAEVTVWAQPALLPLLSTLPALGRLLPLHDGTPEIPFDVDVEVMELAMCRGLRRKPYRRWYPTCIRRVWPGTAPACMSGWCGKPAAGTTADPSRSRCCGLSRTSPA